MSGAKAEELASRLLQASSSLEYGTVAVTLKVVNHEVVRIERSTMESEQPGPKAAGGTSGNRER